MPTVFKNEPIKFVPAAYNYARTQPDVFYRLKEANEIDMLYRDMGEPPGFSRIACWKSKTKPGRNNDDKTEIIVSTIISRLYPYVRGNS